MFKNNNDLNNLYKKLLNITSNIKILHGNFKREIPEQLLALKYIKETDKVLEIGGNIGRNSLLICNLLNQQNNLVTLESDKNICSKLKENRKINNYTFRIIPKALSKSKLYQVGWRTYSSNKNLKNYKEIDIISFNQIEKIFNIQFNVLVLDCEGAFLLKDFPEIINNINKIIIENDFNDIEHKKFVDKILLKNNFYVDYSLELNKKNSIHLIKKNFYEVWLKKV